MTSTKRFCLYVFILIILASGSQSCAGTPSVEEVMESLVQITAVQPDKAFYSPGESVQLGILVQSQVEGSVPAKLVIRISHLTELIGREEYPFSLAPGQQSLTISFPAPQNAPQGYGMDLSLESESGDVLATTSTAFDVLESWTQTPRYGFLSDFYPGRTDAFETMQILARFHINSLQFYDWMYRHEQFLTDEEPYMDLMGRRLSRETIDWLITAAHEHSIAAMPYTAVYGASVAFYEAHPDWALLDYTGKPVFFGDNFMVIMDPRPSSPWTAYLLDQFDQVLEETGFDGIHLDQYGSPEEGYDDQGKKYNLALVLAEFINLTKAHVLEQRPDGAVVFNAVGNWPIENVAPADQDIVYIEVWPPYIWFKDLHDLIVQAQSLGNGKPVVLAAYLDPANKPNVHLVDAIIFASGGAHIELGEQNGILADPYFPKYGHMSPELETDVLQLYDFAVRYQDVIGPRTRDVTSQHQEGITLEGFPTALNLLDNKVWPIVRESDHTLAISLINLLGLKNPEWRKPIKSPPTSIGNVLVHIQGLDRPVSHVWFTTPDGPDLSLLPLQFTQQDQELIFIIPSLAYWDLIVIEWK
jgi:dextranase